MTKLRVNLYSATLLPPKLRLSFAKLTTYIGLLFLSLFAIGAYYYWQVTAEQQALATASQQKQQFDQQKAALEAQIAARKPDAALVARVDVETQQLELKTQLIGELTHRAALVSRGFAPVLKDLASVADTQVWLSRIVMHEQHFMFEGFAEHPQSIPLWLDKLKTTRTLKGQAFSS
ncbi:MAG: fimbrial assembly protein, partial [Shewanella sp.]